MKPLISRQYPVGHLANPRTPYVPAAQTDIRATFARALKEQQEATNGKQHAHRDCLAR